MNYFLLPFFIKNWAEWVGGGPGAFALHARTRDSPKCLIINLFVASTPTERSASLHSLLVTSRDAIDQCRAGEGSGWLVG
jgi:hypothetical protein